MTSATSLIGCPDAWTPTIHAHHQNGGWTRSMPWSKKLPNGEEFSVTRASLPSTVSRKVITQAAARPQPKWPVQKRYMAANTSARLAMVTWLGVMPASAHQRVTIRAGVGQTYFVTRSVTPL